MKMLMKTTARAATGLMMAACTQSGYTERNAAVGAADKMACPPTLTATRNQPVSLILTWP